MEVNVKALDLYHGCDHVVFHPQSGAGKADNDYGSGFYTTRIKERADEWALLYGRKNAVVTHYVLDLTDLKTLNLDDYGPMAWIAEVITHRGVNSMIARDFADDFTKKYLENAWDKSCSVAVNARS